MRNKNEYHRPLMSVERFTPNEFINACWYVEKGNCYVNLVQDVHGVWGIGGPNGGWNPDGGDLTLARDHDNTHRIPGENATPKYFREDEVTIPTNMNDGKNFYDRPVWWGVASSFDNKITTPIYKVTYNSQDHYVKKISSNGHS